MLKLASGESMSASRWLAELWFNPLVADTYPTFYVANQEVLGMFGWPQADKRYCTFAELQPKLQKIDEEGSAAADKNAKSRSPFEVAIFDLRSSLLLYQQLKLSIHLDGTENFKRK